MSSNSEKNRLDRLAMVLAIVAFLTALLFTVSSAPVVQNYGPFLFGFCLGLALILWGRSEQQAGRIKGKSTYVYKSRQPVLFNLFLFIKRFGPGLAMLLAGIWYGLFRSGG